MQVRGTVVNVEFDVSIPKQGGGNYTGARLSYRDSNGKLVEQAFHNNAFKFNAGLKTSLSSLAAGDAIVIEKEKNKNDFWEVKSISKDDGSAAATTASKPVASPKSTYETPEERAQKQVYIVRQSSITNAIALKGAKVSVEEIINVAKLFEAYVFGGEFDDGSVKMMKDDTDGIL